MSTKHLAQGLISCCCCYCYSCKTWFQNYTLWVLFPKLLSLPYYLGRPYLAVQSLYIPYSSLLNT
uniref:Uncharacterized protein n=1 Tax=Nomascus leucogenys TaxID=61853 RepID=A0A2I3GU53_NOMLE